MAVCIMQTTISFPRGPFNVLKDFDHPTGGRGGEPGGEAARVGDADSGIAKNQMVTEDRWIKLLVRVKSRGEHRLHIFRSFTLS